MRDLCYQTDEGTLNVRVGAIIVKNGKTLLIWTASGGHYYTLGGRIRFGESADEAIARELKEEIGTSAELLPKGKLIVTDENFFAINGVRYHELGYYFLFDGSSLPDRLQLYDCSADETLCWLSQEEVQRERLYPLFLKEGIPDRQKHIVIKEWV